jgi:hypothetical protein
MTNINRHSGEEQKYGRHSGEERSDDSRIKRRITELGRKGMDKPLGRLPPLLKFWRAKWETCSEGELIR